MIGFGPERLKALGDRGPTSPGLRGGVEMARLPGFGIATGWVVRSKARGALLQSGDGSLTGSIGGRWARLADLEESGAVAGVDPPSDETIPKGSGGTAGFGGGIVPILLAGPGDLALRGATSGLAGLVRGSGVFSTFLGLDIGAETEPLRCRGLFARPESERVGSEVTSRDGPPGDTAGELTNGINEGELL